MNDTPVECCEKCEGVSNVTDDKNRLIRSQFCCMNSLCACHTPVENRSGACQDGNHTSCAYRGCSCPCHVKTTSTGGEMVYVKAPPFHEPAQAISQSVVEPPKGDVNMGEDEI